MSKVNVYVLKNNAGQFYTGEKRFGEPVFSFDEDDALEMSKEECAEEMAAGVTGSRELFYSFEGRSNA